jgi:hypothetical protein
MDPIASSPAVSSSDRRRGGRRALSVHGSTPVSVKMPTPEFLRLCAIAARMDVSVPELIRRALRREIPKEI